MLTVSDEEVEKLVPIKEVIEAVKKAYAEFSSGRAVMPVRSRLEIREHAGDILLMPCYLPAMNI